MVKETIKFVDYNGVERSGEYYFNLNKAEVIEFEKSINGGISEMIKQIVATNDEPAIIEIFKKLILMSYGEKSNDGLYFLKKDEEGRPLSRKFEQTEAYPELFMKLARDTDAAINFVNGIIPKVATEENK